MIFRSSVFLGAAAWQNREYEKIYERYSGWAKKAQKTVLGGATVNE